MFVVISRTKWVFFQPAVAPHRSCHILKNRRFSMKLAIKMCVAALALSPVVGLAQELPANNPNSTTFTFPLTVSSGAAGCLKEAGGVVIDHTFGNVENLQVVVHGLPPNTDFVLFAIQVPNAPFGLAWYN